MGNETTSAPASTGFFGNLLSSVNDLATTGAAVYQQVKGTKTDQQNSTVKTTAAANVQNSFAKYLPWIIGMVVLIGGGLLFLSFRRGK